jgi:hypothetical protein
LHLDAQPVTIEATMGIDPREGTLLTLVAMLIKGGKDPKDVLASFKDPLMREIARGLAGDANVSPSAREEADRIAKWAGLPTKAA